MPQGDGMTTASNPDPFTLLRGLALMHYHEHDGPQADHRAVWSELRREYAQLRLRGLPKYAIVEDRGLLSRNDLSTLDAEGAPAEPPDEAVLAQACDLGANASPDPRADRRMERVLSAVLAHNAEIAAFLRTQGVAEEIAVRVEKGTWG